MTPEEVYNNKTHYAEARKELEESQNEWINLAFASLGESKLMDELKELAKQSLKAKLDKVTYRLTVLEMSISEMQQIEKKKRNTPPEDEDLPF